MKATILVGDVMEWLRGMPDESVQCVVTSPPYWGLRDYQVAGQLGLEKTPDEYIAKMVEVFREVRRVLRGDGTLWLNIGDSYASNWPCNRRNEIGSGSLPNGKGEARAPRMGDGLKDKDLVGIPWMLAFALRADGWWLRQDIIWSKPNPMPESVTDRCTKAHEYIFLLTKSARYYYNAEAIKEPVAASQIGRVREDVIGGISHEERGQHSKGGVYKTKIPGGWDRGDGAHGTIHRNGRTSAEYQDVPLSDTRNKRSVWDIATQPYPEAHFATYPEALVEPCILAGSRLEDLVLDPFCGSGTTGAVALRWGRDFVGIELSKEYAQLAEKRLREEAPMFNVVSVLDPSRGAPSSPAPISPDPAAPSGA